MTLSGVAALVLGIGLIAFLLVGRAERDLLEIEREREIGEAVRTATALSRRVIEVQRTLRALALQAEGGSLDNPETLNRFVQSTPLLKDIFALLFMAAKDGRIRVYVDDKGVQNPGIDISDRLYFSRTLTEGKPQISEVIYSRLDGATGIVFTQPIRNESGVYGMLAGSVRLSSRGLLDSMLTTQSGYTSSVTVVVTNAEGTILAHPDKSRVAQSLATEPSLKGAFQAWRESGAPIEPQGLLLGQAGEVVSIAGVPGPDWMVWRVRDEAQLLAPLRDARRHALIVAGALIVVLSGAMFAWLGWLLAPLTLLKNRAQHLFDGEVQAEEGWPAASGEIGSLRRVLRRVAIERARLEHLNVEMLGRLRSVMSAAPVGIAIARQDRFELAGDTFCQLFGFAEQELLDRSTLRIFISEEDHAAFVSQERAAFASEGAYAGEWRLQRSDGSRFWARLGSKMVDSRDASMGAIWIVNDIDEQRATRQQLEWSATHDPLTGLANRLAFTKKRNNWSPDFRVRCRRRWSSSTWTTSSLSTTQPAIWLATSCC